MKMKATLAIAAALNLAAYAGAPVPPSPAPMRNWFPEDMPGNITIGTKLSEHLSGVYLDSMLGLWAPTNRDGYLFLDSRYHYEDNNQFISSTGLGFRTITPCKNFIVGANVYMDGIDSAHDNNFNQLGLGLEVLSHWVDVRFNYYLPEDDQYEVGRSTSRSSSVFTRDSFQNGVGSRTTTTTNRKQLFKQFEAALEGYNAEIGFLIPGIPERFETRLFAGYYHYENPFGSDFEGFKARLETHLLKGVIAGVEYWDDARLMGGHWTAELSASVPFSVENLVKGRNPFVGFADSFKPAKRELQDRLGDMVIRSHRVQTTTSGNILTNDVRSSVTTQQVGVRGAGFAGGVGPALE